MRKPSPFAQLPTIVTLGNLLCGLAAIAAATGVVSGLGTAGAVWLVAAALLLDGLDGLAARAVGAASRFGVQLDSLADMVSFGAAPAVLIAAGSAGASPWPRGIVLVASAGYACCTAVRLARYGAQAGETPDGTGFVGLPSPAAAALVGSVTLCEPLRGLAGASAVVGGLAGLLMVAPLDYPHAGRWLAKRSPLVAAVAAAAALGLVVFTPSWGPPALSLAYASSPAWVAASRQVLRR